MASEIPDLPYDSVLCRYGELALKRGNRGHFERLLVEGIRRALAPIAELRVKRESGRVFLELPDQRCFTRTELAAVRSGIPHVFGLSSASIGLSVEPSLASLEAAVRKHFPVILGRFGTRQVTYRMRARRHDKEFPITSRDLEIHFAELLLAAYPQLKLDLVNAELTIQVEVRRTRAFISFDQIEGPAGLPAGSGGAALVLLSGGIDSPVAAYMMMGRGCPLDFLTFHSYPYTTPELIDKVAGLVRVLNQWQPAGRLYACNLAAAQKQIRDHCSERFRTLLYRRLMFRVATVLARHLGTWSLVTGESVGQVASQTIPNLDAINRATDLLVLRPLIGIDKVQTTAIARRIGTFELSAVQCADSCTVFQPQQPCTNARAGLLAAQEERLNREELLHQCLGSIVEVDLANGEQREVAGLI